jgi:hypothetical protein
MSNESDKSLTLLHKLSLLVGFILILIGGLIEFSNATMYLFFTKTYFQTILVSIGCSIFASALISILLMRRLNELYDIQSRLSDWGVCDIGIRSEVNVRINEKLEKMNVGMDIISFGMKNFLAAKGQLLEEKVASGCNIRILTIDPNSPYVSQRETDERDAPGQIKKSINDLIDWAETINKKMLKGKIEVKIYRSLPLDTYQRIDDFVFTGPSMMGIPSQQTIIYGYSPNSKGCRLLTSYFESLWGDRNFSGNPSLFNAGGKQSAGSPISPQ